MVGARVTLRDVATAAGVSVPTASKVLNGGGRVSAATRERILLAAQRLDFRPNALGVFLASGRSQTVGVLARNAPGMFGVQVLTGVITELGRQDMASLLYDAGHDDALLEQHVRSFEARRIDGLVVVGDGTNETLRSVSARFAVPVVYVFGVSEDAADTSFVPDGRMAGRLAGEALIADGRRRIAHITAGNDLAADDRARGLRDALDEVGLGMAGGRARRGDWTAAWGYRAATALLDSETRLDAIFCGNDAIASGAYLALGEHGLSVPGDVALIGVDNADRDIAGRNDLLTTVDPELGPLGRAAVRHLMAAGRGETVQPGVHYHPCTLVARASTGSG